MAGLILGALLFALGMVTFTQHNSITLLLLAGGLVLALSSAARLAASLVMRGIHAELAKRDAMPSRVPAASAPLSSTPIETVSSTTAPPIVVSSNEGERLN